MGRAKLNMELISKEKSRNITFKKRKEGLMRKMHEFTTLCDVSGCMIIYPPKHDKNAVVEPEIWPQDVEEIRRIIDIYKRKSKDLGNKTFGLSDFFDDRKRRIEEELVKLRRKNMEAKYPTKFAEMDSLGEAQLREFYAMLSNKAEYVKSRIALLKQNDHGFDVNTMDLGHGSLIHRGIEWDVINQQQNAIASMKPLEMQLPIHHPSLDHQQDSMLMLLMNDNNDYMQFGGASIKREVFYESKGRGVVDSGMWHDPWHLGQYYAPVLPQVPPQYMPCSGIIPPQLNYVKENDEQVDVLPYQLFQEPGAKLL